MNPVQMSSFQERLPLQSVRPSLRTSLPGLRGAGDLFFAAEEKSSKNAFWNAFWQKMGDCLQRLWQKISDLWQSLGRKLGWWGKPLQQTTTPSADSVPVRLASSEVPTVIQSPETNPLFQTFEKALKSSGLDPLDLVRQTAVEANQQGKDGAFYRYYRIPIPGLESFGFKVPKYENPNNVSVPFSIEKELETHASFAPYDHKGQQVDLTGVKIGQIGRIEVLRHIEGTPVNAPYTKRYDALQKQTLQTGGLLVEPKQRFSDVSLRRQFRQALIEVMDLAGQPVTERAEFEEHQKRLKDKIEKIKEMPRQDPINEGILFPQCSVDLFSPILKQLKLVENKPKDKAFQIERYHNFAQLYRQLEQGILQSFEALANLDSGAFNRVVERLKRFQELNVAPDFQHPGNILITPKGELAFVDLCDHPSAGFPIQDVTGLAKALAGTQSLGYEGDFIVNEADRGKIKGLTDIIYGKLEAAAKANGMAFNREELTRWMSS